MANRFGNRFANRLGHRFFDRFCNRLCNRLANRFVNRLWKRLPGGGAVIRRTASMTYAYEDCHAVVSRSSSNSLDEILHRGSQTICACNRCVDRCAHRWANRFRNRFANRLGNRFANRFCNRFCNRLANRFVNRLWKLLPGGEAVVRRTASMTDALRRGLPRRRKS